MVKLVSSGLTRDQFEAMAADRTTSFERASAAEAGLLRSRSDEQHGVLPCLAPTAAASEIEASFVVEPGVIIPAELGRPVVYGSQLMLATAAVAAAVGMWITMGLGLGLWATSTNFWRDPRVGCRRNSDYSLVLANFTYGTFVACHQPTFYAAGWFCFLGLIVMIFAVNEAKFWLNPAKTRADYARAVWVHLTGVHVLGNAAAWFVLYGVHVNGRCCQ